MGLFMSLIMSLMSLIMSLIACLVVSDRISLHGSSGRLTLSSLKEVHMLASKF